MSSGISHMLFSREALDHIDSNYQDSIKAILRSNIGFYLLGSIAPDLPYLIGETVGLGQTDYADKFHYESTNQIPLEAFSEVKNMVESGAGLEEVEPLFAFFLGYCSHIVADGIVHPYVRDKVGNYSVEGVPELHRKLEMRLDVYACRRVFETELNVTEIHDDLKYIEEDDDVKNNVFDFFARMIERVYSKKTYRAQIESWYEVTHTAFDVSTNDFPQWYKKIIGKAGFSHFNYCSIKDKEADDTALASPCDLDENFLKCAEIDYFDEVVPQFYAVFSDLIVDAYKACFENSAVESIDLPAIDLDIGRLIENKNLSEVPYFWSKSCSYV